MDASGAAYISGYTDANNFPTANALDPSFNGQQDAFVTKLSPAGTALVYSTYLGGIYFESANGIAVDSTGAAYVAGYTESQDFPTVNAYDSTMNGAPRDTFVSKLSPEGNTLAYSTFLGSSGLVSGTDIAIDSAGGAYIAAEYGVFAAKLVDAADLRLTMSASPSVAQRFQNLTYYITVTNLGPTTATDAYLTMDTPPQTTFSGANTSQGFVEDFPLFQGTGLVGIRFGSVAPGSTATATIVVKVQRFASGSIRGEANVSTSAFDPAAGNNRVVRTTPVS